jgi:hypothetical protein
VEGTSHAVKVVPSINNVTGDLPRVVESNSVAVPYCALFTVSAAATEALIPMADSVWEVPGDYESELLFFTGVYLFDCSHSIAV